MSEELHAAAVVAALNAANAVAYDYDDVPKPLPSYYTEVSVSRRFGRNDRNTSESDVAGWRITTRAVAKNVTSAREVRRRQHAALEEQRITVDGRTSTPIKFESAEQVGPDEGWYSGLTTWTYAL